MRPLHSHKPIRECIVVFTVLTLDQGRYCKLKLDCPDFHSARTAREKKVDKSQRDSVQASVKSSVRPSTVTTL